MKHKKFTLGGFSLGGFSLGGFCRGGFVEGFISGEGFVLEPYQFMKTHTVSSLVFFCMLLLSFTPALHCRTVRKSMED